jgi:hypothetical protein
MQKKLAFIFHFRVPVSSRKKCAELRKNERNAKKACFYFSFPSVSKFAQKVRRVT